MIKPEVHRRAMALVCAALDHDDVAVGQLLPLDTPATDYPGLLAASIVNIRDALEALGITGQVREQLVRRLLAAAIQETT